MLLFIYINDTGPANACISGDQPLIIVTSFFNDSYNDSYINLYVL